MTRRIDARAALLTGLVVLLLGQASVAEDRSAPAGLSVAAFLPSAFVRDGSVSYQRELQRAVDAAATSGQTLHFPPMIYAVDQTGLRLHSDMTIDMRGATFQLSDRCDTDGSVFLGTDVSNLCLIGGHIIGRNDRWTEGVNIRGVFLRGRCSNIRVRDMHIQDLSSNGIGVFAVDREHPATDIWVLDTIIDNCCNRYGDYQAPPPERRGPEAGSSREDQGLIAMYHVDDFVVRGCRLEDSRSDGTHFYSCRRGQFTDNRVYRAKMGGYFIESCHHILAANNVILDNGSRGVTIERGSKFCTLTANTIQGSGREGLWIPDSMHCVVTSNIFSLNGRKSNGEGERFRIWNANITVNQARVDKLNTPTANYLIANNIIETDKHQIAAIRVDTRTETRNIQITDNLLIGENPTILVEGPDQDTVTSEKNRGARVQRIVDQD
jgi:parallel beta-helix repeat protein